MLLSSSVNLLPDKTILFQLAIFLVVLVALNHFVFEPVLKIIQFRRTKTKGEKEKLEALHQKTEELVKEYEAKIQEAKQEGFKIKETIRREGESQGQKIIQEARQVSTAQMETIKKEIEKETESASKHLEKEANSLAESLAQKVLGRPLR